MDGGKVDLSGTVPTGWDTVQVVRNHDTEQRAKKSPKDVEPIVLGICEEGVAFCFYLVSGGRPCRRADSALSTRPLV